MLRKGSKKLSDHTNSYDSKKGISWYLGRISSYYFEWLVGFRFYVVIRKIFNPFTYKPLIFQED